MLKGSHLSVAEVPRKHDDADPQWLSAPHSQLIPFDNLKIKQIVKEHIEECIVRAKG
jgi:hypothetical protein